MARKERSKVGRRPGGRRHGDADGLGLGMQPERGPLCAGGGPGRGRWPAASDSDRLPPVGNLNAASGRSPAVGARPLSARGLQWLSGPGLALLAGGFHPKAKWRASYGWIPGRAAGYLSRLLASPARCRSGLRLDQWPPLPLLRLACGWHAAATGSGITTSRPGRHSDSGRQPLNRPHLKLRLVP